MSDDVTLRERTRRAVRGEIAQAALGLFLSDGFDATTVDEIARAAGISRRTFFRYFTSKEAAFAEGLASLGRTVADTLADRPADEDPWHALRRAFDPLLVRIDTDPNAVGLARLMLERPSLQQGKDATWHRQIAERVAERLEGPDRVLRAHALAASAITCLHSAQEQWLAPDEPRPLSALLDISMAAVGRLPG